MTNTKLETDIEFAKNPEPRCACVLVLDSSGSMTGASIAALNQGLLTFKETVAQDPVACQRVEVAVVSFDATAQLIQDFVTIEEFDPPTLTKLGPATYLCAGVNMALDLVEGRKSTYRTRGVPYYQPWVFLITDGAPSEAPEEVIKTGERVKEAENNKKLSFFAVGVDGADMGMLRQISVKDPVRLKGLNFSNLFRWLSASLQRVSGSKAGEQVALPPVGWGTAG